jgi:hypothetical protein
VFTDNRPLSELAAYDAFCRSTPQPSSLNGDAHSNSPRPSIVFLVGGVYGLAAYAFADFGPAHLVTDKDGEAEVLVALTSIATAPDASPSPPKRTPSLHDGSGGHLEPVGATASATAPRLHLELTADRVLVGRYSGHHDPSISRLLPLTRLPPLLS